LTSGTTKNLINAGLVPAFLCLLGVKLRQLDTRRRQWVNFFLRLPCLTRTIVPKKQAGLKQN
jgi:hypothetical protein